MLHNDLSGSPVLIKAALGVSHISAHLTGHPFCFMPSVAEPLLTSIHYTRGNPTKSLQDRTKIYLITGCDL